MNLYFHYVNRFHFLLITGLVFYACEKTEVSCSENDISLQGQQLFVRDTPINNSDLRRTYALTEVGEVALCDTTALSEISHAEFEIGIDSAILRHCDACLELLDWFGPGCDRGFTPTSESYSLVNTVWKLSEISASEETHYTPCFLDVQGVFYDDDIAGFSVRNSYHVSYDLQNQHITFKDPVGTLVGVFGYNRFIEDLFRDELFSNLPFLYELTGNQLILTREDELQFIFYAE